VMAVAGQATQFQLDQLWPPWRHSRGDHWSPVGCRLFPPLRFFYKAEHDGDGTNSFRVKSKLVNFLKWVFVHGIFKFCNIRHLVIFLCLVIQHLTIWRSVIRCLVIWRSVNQSLKIWPLSNAMVGNSLRSLYWCSAVIYSSKNLPKTL
jgi:hypothetical protein